METVVVSKVPPNVAIVNELSGECDKKRGPERPLFDFHPDPLEGLL